MVKYDIKYKSQVETWVRWYKKGEIYRFDQLIGKQYSFGHGPEFGSEDERTSNQVNHLKMENEILQLKKNRLDILNLLFFLLEPFILSVQSSAQVCELFKI